MIFTSKGKAPAGAADTSKLRLCATYCSHAGNGESSSLVMRAVAPPTARACDTADGSGKLKPWFLLRMSFGTSTDTMPAPRSEDDRTNDTWISAFAGAVAYTVGTGSGSGVASAAGPDSVNGDGTRVAAGAVTTGSGNEGRLMATNVIVATVLVLRFCST